MKTIILVLWIVFLFSCKEKLERKIAIYPLSPYMGYFRDSNNITDSTGVWLDFIVYNADKNKLGDTAYIKSILKPFTDSIVEYSKMESFHIEFYKQSKDLDTTYVNGGLRKYHSWGELDGDDDLSFHQYDLIATYEYSKKRRDSSWNFYDKDGSIGRKIPKIEISDIPPKPNK